MKLKSVAVLILTLGLVILALPGHNAHAQDKVLPHEQPAGEEGGLGVTGYDSFNNPNYYYAAIQVPPSGTYYRAAGLSPDGSKIVAQKQWVDGAITRRELVLMDADGTDETVISAGDSGTGDIYAYMNPFWSDDGTGVGYVEVHNTISNRVVVYDIASSSGSYIYQPTAPADVSNPDFLGSSKTSIVFWAYGDVGGADLWTWDGTTLTNITDTDDYKEYEPVSNADGSVIVYWSGESTTRAGGHHAHTNQ